MSLNCPACEGALLATEPLSYRESCEHCHADLHACKYCKNYDSTAYNECREPQAERVIDKEKNNRCDEYKINSNKTIFKSASEDLLQQAEALFKK